MKQVTVVALALQNAEGAYLLATRPEGKVMAGVWEFPGGKLQADETPEAALVRESAEELGLTISPAHLQPLTFVSHPYEDFQLLLLLYGCRRWQGEPRGLEGQQLGWYRLPEMRMLAMPPADAPLIDWLMQHSP